MDDAIHDRDPVEQLAEEFLALRRGGQGPSIDQYANDHPQYAERIRELFPALVLVEELKPRRDRGEERPPPAGAALPLERLGDFRIVREIGRGGMGVVYEAEQESLGRRVAVKVLPSLCTTSAKGLRRFRREARAAARLHHTNIIPIFGVGQQDGIHYYVMQYIRGQGLDHVLAELNERRRSPTNRGVEDATPVFGPPADSREAQQASRGHQPPDGGDPAAARVAQTLLRGGFATPPDHATPQDPLAALSPDTPGSLGTPLAVAERTPLAVPPHPGVPTDSAVPPPETVRLANPFEAGAVYWRSVAGIGVQVAGALDYAHHQGTLHRDIKPANLLLDAHGTVWVADFGLAKLAEQDDLTRSGDVVGTLRYMAPEQFDGRADPRTDVYSLGLTLYEMLTLRPAFDETDRVRLIRQVSQEEPPPPRQVNPAVPRDLETIVMKAVARSPDHRYQSAAELGDDLKRFLDDRPVLARRITPWGRFWRWCRRNKAVAALSGLAVGLLVAVAVVAGIGYVHTSAALVRESNERVKAEDARSRADTERKKAVAEHRRAESNLLVAMLAFEDIFKRIAGDPVYQPRPPADDEADPASPGDEEAAWETQGWTSVVSDKDAAVLQTMLRFYDRFAEQNADNLNLQKETAQAYRRVGEIEQRLGNYEEAEKAFLRALTACQRLLPGAGGSPFVVVETAAVYNRLGTVYRMTGRPAEATSCHVAARDLLVAQPEFIARTPQCRFELARTFNELGSVLPRRGPWPGGSGRPPGMPGPPSSGRPDASVNHLHAMDLLQGLAAEFPDNPDYRLALARAYRDLANAGPRRGRGDDPSGARQEAIRLLEMLVADHPHNPDYRFELAETYAMSGRRFGQGGPSESEIKRLFQAVDIETQIVHSYPNVPDYQAALARLHTEVARSLQAAGRVDEAIVQLRQGIELQRALADRFPEVPQYHVGLVRDLFLLAYTLRSHGHKADARAVLQEALGRAEMLEALSSNPMTRAMLGRGYASLAELLKQLDLPAEADEARRKSEQHGGASAPFPRGTWGPDRLRGFSRPRGKATDRQGSAQEKP